MAESKKPLYVYLIVAASGAGKKAIGVLPQPIGEHKYFGKEYSWMIARPVANNMKIVGSYRGYFIKKVASAEEFKVLARELKGKGRSD